MFYSATESVDLILLALLDVSLFNFFLNVYKQSFYSPGVLVNEIGDEVHLLTSCVSGVQSFIVAIISSSICNLYIFKSNQSLLFQLNSI